MYSSTDAYLATHLKDLGRLISFDNWRLHLVFFFLQLYEILYRPQLIDTNVVTAALAHLVCYQTLCAQPCHVPCP